jgi:hypothetical protein
VRVSEECRRVVIPAMPVCEYRSHAAFPSIPKVRAVHSSASMGAMRTLPNTFLVGRPDWIHRSVVRSETPHFEASAFFVRSGAL